MFTTEQARQIENAHERAARNEIWTNTINGLRVKPDIRIDDAKLHSELQRVNWWSHMEGVAFYKDVSLNIQLTRGPWGWLVFFPRVYVLQKGHWDGTRYETDIRTKAESSENTDELYEKIQKAHKRYLSLLKRREREQAELKRLDNQLVKVA